MWLTTGVWLGLAVQSGLQPSLTEPVLRWTAPAGCPSSAEVERLLASELGPDNARLSTSIEVRRDADRWSATVVVEGGEPRTLTADSCRDLAEAAVVMVAVASDPALPDPASKEPAPEEPAPAQPPGAPSLVPRPTSSVATEDLEPRPRTDSLPPDASATPAPPDTNAVASKRAPVALEREQLDHVVTVGGGAGYGPVSALSGEVGARYGLLGDRWRFEVHAGYATPRRLFYDDRTLGGMLSAVELRATGCGEPVTGRVSFPLCIGSDLAIVFGQGVGAEPSRRSQGVALGVTATLGLRVRLTDRLGLRIDGDLAAKFVRPAFHIGDRDPFYRAPWVGGGGFLGLEIGFR